jgi:hypothetical protein
MNRDEKIEAENMKQTVLDDRASEERPAFNGFQTGKGNPSKISSPMPYQIQNPIKLEENDLNNSKTNETDTTLNTDKSFLTSTNLDGFNNSGKRISLDNSKHFKRPQFNKKIQTKYYIDPAKVVVSTNSDEKVTDQAKAQENALECSTAPDISIVNDLCLVHPQDEVQYLKLVDIVYLNSRSLIKPVFTIVIDQKSDFPTGTSRI